MSTPFVLALRKEFKQNADAAKAPFMQAYMKSEMPYHGIPSPLQKKISQKFFEQIPLPDAATWMKLCLTLWQEAKFREERYAAVFLTSDKRAKAFQTPAAMTMYETMIVSGAWWDFVDEIASNRVGPILRTHPSAMKKCMREWSRSSDLWKARTSILCQLGFKRETDVALLYACIEPSIDSKEFFLRKAIGWALRQLARSKPKEVKRYVKENEARLSPLSQREALKHLS